MGGEEILIEEALRSDLGWGCDLRKFDDTTGPLAFGLDRIRETFKKDFLVYWVEHGLPSHYCMQDGGINAIAFSPRYVAISHAVRTMLFDVPLENMAVAFESLALRLISEFSIWRGALDQAVYSSSLAFRHGGVATFKQPEELIRGPYNEAFMANWFFALLHELGHVHAEVARSRVSEKWTSQQKVERNIEEVAKAFFPDRAEREAMLRSVEGREGNGRYTVEQMVEEHLSDVFAVQMLMPLTRGMLQLYEQELDMDQFILDIGVHVFAIAFIDLARQSAYGRGAQKVAGAQSTDVRMLQLPIVVRLNLILDYLDVMTLVLRDEGTTAAQAQKQVTRHNRALVAPLFQRIREGVKGLDMAMALARRGVSHDLAKGQAMEYVKAMSLDGDPAMAFVGGFFQSLPRPEHREKMMAELRERLKNAH